MFEVSSSPHDTLASQARLRIRDLEYSYDQHRVLSGVDLDVAPGEIVGVLGPNGSGKSTILALVAGLLRREKGRMEFEGRAVEGGDRDMRRQLGVVFQTPSVDLKLTARENLHLVARMQGFRGKAALDLVQKQLEMTELEARADEPLQRFSGGMRRRVDLVRALLHQPSLLLMDEASVGLDEGSFRRLWSQIKAARKERGLAILLATHRPEEAAMCDRLLIINEGRIIANASPEQLISELKGDVVALRASEPENLCKEINSKEFSGLARGEAMVEGEDVILACQRGHELIVKLVESFEEGRIESIQLRRPSLADVFFRLTGGSSLDEENRR